ncbi:MAG: hypothetical protein QOJ19_2685 [Acidimicrobiia bacterium]|nr:hypothetical protein [Acidimicrobiia bacterium]
MQIHSMPRRSEAHFPRRSKGEATGSFSGAPIEVLDVDKGGGVVQDRLEPMLGIGQLDSGFRLLGEIAEVSREQWCSWQVDAGHRQLDGKVSAVGPHGRELHALAQNGTFARCEVLGEAHPMHVA